MAHTASHDSRALLFALFAALDADLNVDQDAIKDGMAFMDEMTDPATGTFCASVSWMSPVPGGRSTTR